MDGDQTDEKITKKRNGSRKYSCTNRPSLACNPGPFVIFSGSRTPGRNLSMAMTKVRHLNWCSVGIPAGWPTRVGTNKSVFCVAVFLGFGTGLTWLFCIVARVCGLVFAADSKYCFGRWSGNALKCHLTLFLSIEVQPGRRVDCEHPGPLLPVVQRYLLFLMGQR